MEELKKRVMDMLLRKGTLRLSRPLSPIPRFDSYLNIDLDWRGLKKKDISLIAECLWYMMLKTRLNFQAIAGIPGIGSKIADAMFNNVPTPCGFRVVPLQKDEDGIITHVPEFGYNRREGVVLVDFALNNTSIMQDAAAALLSQMSIPRNILVLIDFEPENHEVLGHMGYIVHLAFTMKEFLDYGREEAKISFKDYHRALDCLNNGQCRI